MKTLIKSVSVNTWNNVSEFKESVQAWADRVGVNPGEIHMRPMKTKWASYSSKGRITFDAGLLTFNREFGEYVILHELLHIKIPNHGKLFKSLMSAYMPDWKNIMARNTERLKNSDSALWMKS